jgi:hypothetical protein
MDTYTRVLFTGFPILIVAIAGRWLIRRRWARNPEVCALLTWGCGLLIADELAYAGFAAWATASRELQSQALGAAYWSQILTLAYWLYAGLLALPVWLLLRGALVLLDAPASGPEGFTARQLDALFPVVRTHRTLSGTSALVVTERQVLIGRVRESGDRESLLTAPDPGAFEACTKFDLSPRSRDDLSIVVEQVGIVGPGRQWRRLRFATPEKSRTFWVPLTDYANLRDALRHVVPGGLTERDRPRRSAWDRLLLVLSILFVLINLTFHQVGRPDGPRPEDQQSQDTLASSVAATIALGVSYVGWFGPLAVLVAYLATGYAGLRSRYRPPPPPARVRRGPATGKRPFRSAVLGVSLKWAAFVYTLFLFGSPAVDQRLGGTASANGPRAGRLLWGLLVIPCGAMMFVGHRLGRRVFTPGAHHDSRPPFLFLRAFADDDRRTIQPRSWLARLHGIPPDFGRKGNRWSAVQFGYMFHPARWFRTFLGLPADTVEELLAIGLRGVGPLIAVGEPHERQVTSGADRMYVSDDRWQQVVLEYLKASAGVILQPSLTDGVLWEIEQTFLRVSRERVLLSFVNYQDRPNDYEWLWLLLSEKYNVRLPRSVPHLDRPCFVFFAADGTAQVQPVVYYAAPWWPLLGTAVDIRATLGRYLSGLAGGAPTKPAPPNRLGFIGIVMSLLLLGIVTMIPLSLSGLVRWLLSAPER